MSAAAALLDSADPAEDRAQLDRQLAKLERLGDLGLEIAEALAAQAKGTGPQVIEGDLALAYDRVARAVRMAVLLQSRLMADLRRARDQAAVVPSLVPSLVSGADPGAEAVARKDQVARIVKRVAGAQRELDAFQVSWCAKEASQRLEHDDIYGRVMSQPVSELVADICRDLGLTPDWSRLVCEAWAQDEIDSGEVGEPLQDFLDEAADPGDDGGAPPDEASPPAPAPAIPTLQEAINALARDPAILAAAGRRSG